MYQSLYSPGSGVYTWRYSLYMKVYTHEVFSTSPRSLSSFCPVLQVLIWHVVPVAPVWPHFCLLKQQSPRTNCYRTSLLWLPISANMWSDWNGQPQVSQAGPEAKTLLHSQVFIGHVSSLFSWFIWSSRSAEILRLSLHDLYLYMTLPSGKPRSCYSILLQLIFLNLTENKTAFLLVLFQCVEKLPWSASAV